MSLLNAFIDAVVCVGFNSNDGLIIDQQSENTGFPFLSYFQSQVLAILSANEAVYRHSKKKYGIDRSYPSADYSSTISRKKHIVPNVYSNLPLFCFPDGVKIARQHENTRIHQVVLTQEGGKRSYAVILTLPEQFLLITDKPNDDGAYPIEPLTMSKRSTEVSESFYLPHCLVLVSSYPYWIAMLEVISMICDEILHERIDPSSDSYRSLIQKYAFLACNTPIPPAVWARFSLSFTLPNYHSVIFLDPPIHSNRPILDIDLSILLFTLNIGKLLDVLAAILTQQPILFFSSDCSKLVTTLECLLYLIYPLKWNQTYIPIVPDSLRDFYLEGPPGSYIMGAHSRHQSTVEELNISLTCSLDNDRNIHVPHNIQLHRLPPKKSRRFIDQITKFLDCVKNVRSLQNVRTPTILRVDQQREIERQHRLETNQKITDIFLDLMVELYGDVYELGYWEIGVEQQTTRMSSVRSLPIERENCIPNYAKFRPEKYLLQKTGDLQEVFYQMLIESTTFHHFIDEETASPIQTDFQEICHARLQANQYLSYNSNATSIDYQVTSTSSLFDSSTIYMLLPLPDWLLDVTTCYLDSCIDVFSAELHNAREEHSLPVITAYSYLRGCALLARDQLLGGLHDLYSIENRGLFPKEYIETIIVPLLVDDFLLDLFIHESFYTNVPEWKKLQTSLFSQKKMSLIDLEKSEDLTYRSSHDELPTEMITKEKSIGDELSLEQFREHVCRLSIVNDEKIAGTIFRFLLYWTETMNKLSEEQISSIDRQRQNRTEISSSVLSYKQFQLFFDLWKRKNTEKPKWSRFLPEDRQKQEPILMVSSTDIGLGKDDRGQLILTQRGIYFLPKSSSRARLLTEFLNIIFIENGQQKTSFFSSKPVVKIYGLQPSSSSTHSPTSQQDAQALVILFFKDSHEQDFWYRIINELRAGVSIAQEECDTSVLQKLSQVIGVIDVVVAMGDVEQMSTVKSKRSTEWTAKFQQNFNQTIMETVLSNVTVFTQMQNRGDFKKLTVETRNALYDRLSPSVNETEREAVRCLVFTENPDTGSSLLWCAYGPKLKIFNADAWTLDRSDICFPSAITCICLDAHQKLWIGCSKGQLFVVDTLQCICGTQLAVIEGKGGVQIMVFDSARNLMLVANRSGLVCRWDVSNRQRLTSINLQEIYEQTYLIRQRMDTNDYVVNIDHGSSLSVSLDHNLDLSCNELKSIQIDENLLFACYRDDYILIFHIIHSDTYVYDDIISVKNATNGSIPINSFLVHEQQLWISATNILYIYKIKKTTNRCSYDLVMKDNLNEDCLDHLQTMLGCSGYIWAGSSRGNIYIFQMNNYKLFKTLDGHKDGICCLCLMFDTHVISGSQQGDTSIVIWENVGTAPDDVITTRL